MESFRNSPHTNAVKRPEWFYYQFNSLAFFSRTSWIPSGQSKSTDIVTDFFCFIKRINCNLRGQVLSEDIIPASEFFRSIICHHLLRVLRRIVVINQTVQEMVIFALTFLHLLDWTYAADIMHLSRCDKAGKMVQKISCSVN